MQFSATAQWRRPPQRCHQHSGSRVRALRHSRDAWGGQRGAPNQPSPPLLKSRLFVPSKAWTPHRLEASLDQRPLLFLQGLVSGGMQLLQLPHPRVPRSLQNISLVLLNAQCSHLLPGALERQEAGEHWNMRCLRSEPKFDLSWVEMREKWPRTTRSFTSFPDLAAAGAGLPNQTGFGQDICSSAGHKTHLDPLRELRAIKFS